VLTIPLASQSIGSSLRIGCVKIEAVFSLFSAR
jgi:hypothetical protein